MDISSTHVQLSWIIVSENENLLYTCILKLLYVVWTCIYVSNVILAFKVTINVQCFIFESYNICNLIVIYLVYVGLKHHIFY